MSLAAIWLAIGLGAQQQALPESVKPADAKPAQANPPEEVPPEEDQSVAPKEYAFNPIQATKELRVGDYYMKRGKYRAAAERFSEATKWNGQLADAYLKLGEAEEKQDDAKAAREAYRHYLELSPDGKNAGEVRKRIQKLGPA